MKVLVVGGGGREHALVWKIAASPRVARVYAAPGNAGTAGEPKVENVPIAAEDIDALVAFAAARAVELTVIGPEAPLVAGIVDRFASRGLRCFGPSAAAARLEGSKAYSKAFLARHGIPTAAYASFDDLAAARAHIESRAVPMVVKADGLAAGKGVVVAQRRDAALAAAEQMLEGARFGGAGRRVVVEDFLDGEEASFIVMADGARVLPLATSQDHKARDDGDRGPNTGGMGAYSPAAVVTPEVHARVMREVIRPTVAGLRAEGMPYTGILYAGLMIDAAGRPRVLEFNCRFGDPEAQPILLRLASDLVELIEAALDGRLDRVDARWDGRAALGVVMAAGGYPGDYRSGDRIQGIPAAEAAGCKVFHAGTAPVPGGAVTAGGRVLCVTALGESVAAAQQAAYRGVAQIHWPDAYWRRDIGHRAIARERAGAGRHAGMSGAASTTMQPKGRAIDE